MDFYLDDGNQYSEHGIYISYKMFTVGMGDVTVNDIIKEYEKDSDVEQIIYQEGNKAFVCEGFDKDRGNILVGTLEQGTYYMAMIISFDSEYTNFCRAFAKEIYTQYNNTIVFAPPEPLVVPERENVFVNDLVLEEGKIIEFGYYEQDNIIENGFEPIEWEVLEVTGDKAFIISKNILDYELYENKWDSGKVTWEESDLRNWLNGYFYDIAFVDSEKEIILESEVINSSEFLMTNDTETIDKIFCISLDEWLKYFSESKEIPLTTKYAEEDASEVNNCYWLRTPGASWGNYGSQCIANGDGWWEEHSVIVDTGVRPAMWIEIK